MKKEQVFFLKTQNKYLSAAKIICLSFLFSVPVETFAAGVKEAPAVNVVQQQGIVKGTVVDAQGEPIIGASITIKGGTIGTITDIDGNFSLTVPSGSQIVVSFIGYTRQFVTPKAGQSLKIVLQEDTKTLDEVVVVGYGTQKMKNVTGSVATVSPKDIEELPVSSLAEALSGQMPGVSVSMTSNRPGDGATIRVRQARRLEGLSKAEVSAVPLVIIDDVIQLDDNGQPTLEQFNLLDASEIETITVLRDASAAIYGSRASNGAILVKTRRGKAGKTRISYSGKFAYNDAVSHSKVLTGSDYGRFSNSYVIGMGKAKNHQDLTNIFSDNELQALDGLNYNWLEEADWSGAFTMNHSLNVSGGSEKATYFAGVSYYDQGANLGKQDYNKYTFRTGVDVKISSDLKLSATLAGNRSERESVYTKGARFNAYGGQATTNSDYNILHHMPRHIPWSVSLTDAEGNEKDYWVGPTANTYGNVQFANTTVTSWNYFAQQQNGSYNTNDDNSWNANVSLSYDIPFIKGLSVRGNYATTHSTGVNEQISFPYQVAYLKSPRTAEKHLEGAWENTTNRYNIKDFTSNSQARFYDHTARSEQMNFYINYDRTFGMHNISAMASVERAKSTYTTRTLIYENLPADAHEIFTGVGYKTLGDLKDDTSLTGKGESGTLSYLGRVNYSYADRYMLQVIFRTDASSKFAPENYWGFFPGISAGWIVSEESWFKQALPWFEYLKMRASWGRTGKDNVKMWQWTQTYGIDVKGEQFGPNGGILGSSVTPSVSPNRKLKWDKTDKFNIGFDTRFLNGRLSVGIDVYYDKNDDILNKAMSGQVGIPIFAGGGYSEENYGRVDTYGAEFSINWRDKVGQVNYNIGVDFGLDGNKVKKWPEDLRFNKYPSGTDWEAGMTTIFPVWGFNVWKGTSSGDGILRTTEDIDNYWNYLQANADAAGTSPKYFGKAKNELKLGMLAYQDLGGAMVDGVQEGPNGQIDKEQDYTKLCKKDKSYGFTTKLGASWKNLSFRALISTSWGGVRFIDRTEIKSGNGNMVWTPDSFWGDMYDSETNVNGKYPNLGADRAIGGSVVSPSDFWMIGTFRCYIKNLSVAYSLPKNWLTPIKIESAKLSLTGTNLWDFYNPYPKHYRNMYDKSGVDYPTLRTWSLGVNVTF